MGIFDFLKANQNGPSVDLTDFKFLSDDHTRIEQGRNTDADNKGAWRGIRIKALTTTLFAVTIYNMNENHPVWGDNIQMSEKPMNILQDTEKNIILRGVGRDAFGSSYADYGVTLHISNGKVTHVTLHMHDRKVDIIYTKSEIQSRSVNLESLADFDNFKAFIHNWNTTMSQEEKLAIAIETDSITNQGVDAYNNGDIRKAIFLYERVLSIMPNNDDALQNLEICYTKIGRPDKASEMVRKLNYIS